MAKLDLLLSKLDKVKGGNGVYRSACPAHQGKNQTLKISERDNGDLGVYCFKGCSAKSVMESVGLNESDMFAKSLNKNNEEKIQEYFTASELDKIDTKIWIVAQGHADINNGIELTEADILLWKQSIKDLKNNFDKLKRLGYIGVCKKIMVAIEYKSEIKNCG